LFNTWNQNVAQNNSLAAGTTPVAGAGVTGSVKTNSVGIAPASSVAVNTTNMLVSQNFDSPDTVASQLHWTWDGTDGNITLGCALVLCDGTQDDLVSNEIPVVSGERIEVSCQVKWEAITYTGTKPIILGVERYRKGKDTNTGGATYLDLGGVDVSWLVSPDPDGGWGDDGDLAGIYVVEPGVDQLRFRLRAASNITDGIVKWDEAVFLKLDLINDAAVPGVGTTVDDIVRQLFGAQGESFTHNDAAVALANTSSVLTSINARLSATEASSHTGSVAGDDFVGTTGEITGSPNWGGVYSLDTKYGYYNANGSDVVWHPTFKTPYISNQKFTFDWEGADEESATDYQVVQLLLSSAPTATLGFHSYIHLLGRITAGWSSYVLASFGSDKTYAVKYFAGGSLHTLASGTCVVPGAGTLLSFYLGDKTTNNLRHFRLTANITTIADFTETGAGSPIGASNRKWGWGGQANGGFILFLGGEQSVPPKVNQWLGFDQ